MIRMTKQTDYGIELLTHVARTRDRDTITARDLAKSTRLPRPTVSKVLKLLAREGILRSHRGVKGGYSLARSPSQITLADIVIALEGPVAITACISEAAEECERYLVCGVRSNSERINGMILNALRTVTLTEMSAPLMERAAGIPRTAGRLDSNRKVDVD